jgi:predicted methyltransferase
MTGDPILPYPITFSSLDDTATITIATADEILWMYLSAVARVQEIVASGNQQKNYIRDEARTAQELISFVDSRPLPAVIPVEPGQPAQ